jgi:hypothetical protein
MGCAFAAAAPASDATHYRINALVKHSRQPLIEEAEYRGGALVARGPSARYLAGAVGVESATNSASSVLSPRLGRGQVVASFSAYR